jgi:hypothetical protein
VGDDGAKPAAGFVVTASAREEAIYTDLLGEAEAIYGRPVDASLRAVLRKIARERAAA